MFKFFSSKKVQVLVIVVLTTLAYSNIFANDFAIDDGDFLFNWPLIKVGEIGEIREIGERIGRIITFESVPQDHAGVYRPIKAVAMMVALKIFGVKAFGFHLVSIAVHLVNTVLVYLIVARISTDVRRMSADSEGTKGQRDKVYRGYKGSKKVYLSTLSTLSLGHSVPNLLPFLTALLFGLHPVHTEAVTFILASFDTLGLTFYLGSFAAYLYANDMRMKIVRMDANPSTLRFHSGPVASLRTSVRMILRVGSVVFAILGFFTYELAVTLPFVLVLYEWTLGRGIKGQSMYRGTEGQRDKEHRVYKGAISIFTLSTMSLSRYVPKFLPYFAGLAFYIWVRFFVLDLVARGEYLGGSFYKTALVEVRALVKYLELLIWPVNLSIDHQILPGIYSVVYKAFVSTKTLESLSILTPVILASLIVLILLAVLFVVCLPRLQIFSFAIGWFLLTLSPVLFIIPQSAVMAERYVYLGSFGFCLAAAWVVTRILTNKDEYKRILVIMVVIFVSLGYGVRTYVRNFDWKDTLTVWEKLAVQSPDNPVTNYTLAKIYAEKDRQDLAIVYFEKALATYPNIPEVNFRLGKIYYARGQLDLAQKYFLASAREDNPRYFFMARRELAKIEYLKGQRDKGTKGQSIKSEENWLRYVLEERVTFEYPQSWMVTKFEKGAAFDALDVSFSVEIFIDGKDLEESFESYLSRQPDHFGKLVGEGAARVPNVGSAYVKVWKDDEVDKLEFFLNDGDVVLKILVYPTNAVKMREFDRLLGSIKIE